MVADMDVLAPIREDENEEPTTIHLDERIPHHGFEEGNLASTMAMLDEARLFD